MLANLNIFCLVASWATWTIWTWTGHQNYEFKDTHNVNWAGNK